MESAPLISSSPAVADRRARLTKTFAYYTAFVILGLAAAVFGPTLQGLGKNTGSGVDQLSYVFVLRSLGYLVGSFLAGRLYDRVKGHPLMAVAILVLAAATFFIPLVHFLWLLAALVLVLGTAEGLVDVGGNTLLTWVHRDELKMYMNGLHFFFGLGALLSPIIVGLVLERTGAIQWSYWMLAVFMLPPALWLARLPSPPPIVHTEAAPNRPAVPLLIGMLALFMFLYVGCEVSYGAYVSKYAIDSSLGSESASAFLASGFWGALTAGRLIGIPLSARYSARRILLVDLLIVLVGLAITITLPGSLNALWIGTLCIGVGMASIFPTVLILAEQHMTITGSVTSWFFVGSSLGGMTISWLIGQLFARSGPGSMMMVLTAGIVLTLVLYGVIMFYIRRLAAR